jgi:hypothetical protein
MSRKEWKPNRQLMIRIGDVRKNDSPLPSFKMHLQNPVKCPDLQHPHQEVQKRRRIIMMNKTVQDAMKQTAMETYLIDCHEAGVDSCKTEQEVVTSKMATLNIDTTADLRDKLLPIITAHQCTVQPSVITPMSETDSFNTTLNEDSVKGCWNLLTSGQSTRGLLSISFSSEETMTRARTLSDDHTDGRLLTGSLMKQSCFENMEFMSGQVAV